MLSEIQDILPRIGLESFKTNTSLTNTISHCKYVKKKKKVFQQISCIYVWIHLCENCCVTSLIGKYIFWRANFGTIFWKLLEQCLMGNGVVLHCHFLCPIFIYICSPVKSLDTPTHSRVFLYVYYFLHCRIIVKTSKLLNNTYGIME